MVTRLQSVLADFMNNTRELYQAERIPMLIPHEPDWDSPIYQGQPNSEGMVQWLPVPQIGKDGSLLNHMQNVAGSLEIEIPSEVEQYYCSYWAPNLPARTQRGGLELLFPWNQEDFERFQKNLVAHILMKRRLGQRETWFFAVTDEEDFNLSVLNDTGEVVLEPVGKEPSEVLATSLSEFIASLQPVIPD